MMTGRGWTKKPPIRQPRLRRLGMCLSQHVDIRKPGVSAKVAPVLSQHVDIRKPGVSAKVAPVLSVK